MNTTALIRLADKLDGVGPYAEVGPVPAKRFEIREWFRWSVMGPNTDPQGCGFAACAVGWACTDPWFKEFGLVPGAGPHAMVPSYREYEGFFAVAKAFDISPQAADWLFSHYAYLSEDDDALSVTPEMVASRIRQFVDDGGMPASVEAE